jgi:kynurenine 3-monooxygenase
MPEEARPEKSASALRNDGAEKPDTAKADEKERTQSEVDIALIGGGPVGALLAYVLARREFEVDVYERRPDLRTTDGSGGRSINLALSTRGLTALKLAGLEEEVLKISIPMRGRMIHTPDGQLLFQQYGKDDSEYINSISRGALNQLLLTKAEETGKVHFHFTNKATNLDARRNSLTLLDETTKTENEILADIVIGCDGSASALRSRLESAKYIKSSESVLDYGYKELTLPAGKNGGYQIEKNALHIWPRGTFMLIALPNLDGSFTCTLFLPFEGENGFDSLTNPDAVVTFFKKHFADALDLIPDLAKSFFENPTGHMTTIKCDSWNAEGRVLLLGDAAHAIVPFFGQGMNCGFEDVNVLENCMTEHVNRGGALYLDRRTGSGSSIHKRQKEGSTGWETVFQDFVKRRKDNTDAIADLAVENFIEMRDKVANPQFQLEKMIEKVLQTKFPDLYVSRYRLVTFTNVPYAFARQAGEICDEILKNLCEGIKTADEVDLTRAEKLIRTRLTPLLNQRPELVQPAGGHEAVLGAKT